jgi:hypothetical protein
MARQSATNRVLLLRNSRSSRGATGAAANLIKE